MWGLYGGGSSWMKKKHGSEIQATALLSPSNACINSWSWMGGVMQTLLLPAELLATDGFGKKGESFSLDVYPPGPIR